VSESYVFWRLAAGVLATIGLYSVLYRENKFYRFFEHMFLGLAGGYTLYALWSETLFPNWWTPMMGSVESTEAATKATNGYWLYILLLPIGLMGYFVFSKKHNWMSRIPIGIILGLFSAEQFQVFLNRYGKQVSDSMKPIFPTSFDSFTIPSTTGLAPEEAARVSAQLYPSQALSNLIYVFTLLCVLSYFLFSIEIKGKGLKFMTTSGRWLLMIGFGAIFGSTVMMRFTLLIDRMYFIWIEFLQKAVLKQ
jgi:hypothetical protein